MVLVDHQRDVLTEYLGMYSEVGETLVNDFLVREYGLTLTEVCADVIAHYKINGLFPGIDDLSDFIDTLITSAFQED